MDSTASVLLSGGSVTADDGWVLIVESWSFHRQFFARVGRPAGFGEYFDILRQIRRRRAEAIAEFVYRVTLADGQLVAVRWERKSWARVGVLCAVLPPDWTPPRPPQVAAELPPPEPPQVAAELPPPEPPQVAAELPPPEPPQVAAEPPPPEPPQVAAEPPPPPRRPLRATTLTLGTASAGAVLAQRMRQFGLPEADIRRATSG